MTDLGNESKKEKKRKRKTGNFFDKKITLVLGTGCVSNSL